MDNIFQRLRPFIRLVVRRAPWVIAVAMLVSLFGFYEARKLRIDTDFSNLIPGSYPSVQALEKLRDTVGGESEVSVVIQSPSFEENKSFAEALIPRALALTGEGRSEPYLGRVDYRKDTAFLEDNALYFATDAELDSLEDYLQNRITDAKLEANPFFFDLDDDEDEVESDAGDDGIGESLNEVYTQIVGKEYPVSADSTVMVLQFYPTGSQTNIGFIEDLYRDLDVLVDEMNAAAFHPQMEVTLAGRLLRQAVEIRAVTNDVISSFGAGVLAVLLCVVAYFFYKGYHARAGRRFDRRVLLAELARTPVLAFVIGLPLLMSLTWTFGAAYLAFGTLNLMTSTLGLVLFGLGIDYGIHFYARYTEERGRGHDVAEAAEITFASTGQAIAVGAMTTAAALYVLVIADFRGFSEFGFIAGTGILFALLSMTVVLPALIAVLERLRLLDLEASTRMAPVFNGRSRRFPAARGLVLGSLVAVGIAIVFLPRLSFEYEFSRLEPEYNEYEARRELVRQVYNGSNRRNPAYIIVDNQEEVVPVANALRAHAAQDTLTPTIGDIETLQDRFPISADAKRDRLARVASIREMLQDPFIQAEPSADLARLERAAQTTEPITLDQVPAFLKNRFASKSGELGNFIMIYPSVGLADGRQSMAFSEDVGTVVTKDGRVYHAGSTSLVAADMLRLMLDEAPWMVLVTFLIVGFLMWVNFGSVRWALFALLPLAVGVLWMLLIMEMFALKLNFYNLVVLPAVLGIGNDAGVHLVHRFREEGPGSLLHVLQSTGEHVAMGSLTTMIGFGGLLLSFHPGLESIGQLAVAGIGATLLAALLFLPALLQWVEDRRRSPFEVAHAEPNVPVPG